MYRSIIALSVGMLLAASSAAAQDSLAWNPAVDAMFTLTQNTYSDNWAGGDLGSITWVGTANLGLEKQFVLPWHWRNTLTRFIRKFYTFMSFKAP